MANTKNCIKKPCSKCGKETRGTWRYKRRHYCYSCYQGLTGVTSKLCIRKEIKEILKKEIR